MDNRILIFIAALGAMMNRIRGGAFGLPAVRIINALAFMGVYYYFTHNFLISFLAGLGMWLGSLQGWGRYIGYMGGVRGNWTVSKDREEVKWIDWILSKFELSDRLWGFFGLMIRGFSWGMCIAVLSLNPLAIIAGLLMPVVYYISISLEQIVMDRNGWEFAEASYGAIFWVTCLTWVA